MAYVIYSGDRWMGRKVDIEAEDDWEIQHMPFLFPDRQLALGIVGCCFDCVEAIYDILESCRERNQASATPTQAGEQS